MQHPKASFNGWPFYTVLYARVHEPLTQIFPVCFAIYIHKKGIIQYIGRCRQLEQEEMCGRG